MTDYGIKISQDGYDVKTADIKNLVLTSKANQFKIHLKGTLTFTSNNQTQTVAHGLAYTPSYIAFQKLSANAYYNFADTNTYIDGTNLTSLGNNGDILSSIIFKDIGA